METQNKQAVPAVEVQNPFLTAPSGKKMLTLIGVYVALIGSIIHSASLSTLLPVAAADIGGTEYYSLVSTLTGVLSIAAMPLWGYFGARNPAIKRPLFTASLLIGAAVVLVRAFAPTMIIMVIPAAFYGLVSAGIYVLGYSIIRDMYDSTKAGIYLGACGTMMAIGMLIGPVLGGFIMDIAGWRWVCHGIWPILALGGLMVFFGVKATKEQTLSMAYQGGAFDLSGAIAVVIFLAALIVGLSMGTTFIPFGSIISIMLFITAALALIALIFIIRKKKDAAIVPAPALKDQNTLNFAIANLFINFSNMAVFFFMPLYVLSVMGLSAMEAGLTTTCLSVVGLFLSPILGRMIGTSGNARGVLSFATIVRILVAIALLVLVSPSVNIWVIYVILLIGGIYNSAQGSVFSAGPQIQIPPKLRVQGNSVIQVGQNLGSAMGVAVYTVLIGMFGVVGGMPVALAVSIGGAVIGLIFALRLRKLEEPEQLMDVSMEVMSQQES